MKKLKTNINQKNMIKPPFSAWSAKIVHSASTTFIRHVECRKCVKNPLHFYRVNAVLYFFTAQARIERE